MNTLKGRKREKVERLIELTSLRDPTMKGQGDEGFGGERMSADLVASIL